MMEAQIDRQIAMLWDLLAELQKTEDQNRARRLLGQVIIIGTYIKRRSNLIFVGYASMNLPRISVSMAPTVRQLSRGMTSLPSNRRRRSTTCLRPSWKRNWIPFVQC